MRTFIWFVYFWSYLLFHLPTLHRGLKAQKAGNITEADAIAKEHVSHWFNRLLALAGVEVTVTGQENLPNVPCVFVANHRSYYDIPLMMTQIMGPIPLVSKIEVQKFPIVNKWMELLHCLFLDRSDPRQGMQVINDAAELIGKGYCVGIFPEGTRFKGEEGEVGTFLSGAFRIASKSGAPIVPVAIGNSRACLEADGHFTMKPAKVTMHILPPIETAGLSRTELKALPDITRQQIQNALKQ